MDEKTRILIVDDSPCVRKALTAYLSTHDWLKVICEAADGEEALEKIDDYLRENGIKAVVLSRLRGPAQSLFQKFLQTSKQARFAIVILTADRWWASFPSAATSACCSTRCGTPSRSRRYHRPLAMLLIEVDPEVHRSNGEALKDIQYDIVNRFTSARIGQIIDDRIRQTDLVIRDRQWSYVVICPETDYASVVLLARRISEAVREKTDYSILWGVASFPEEALTFDDMMKKARERLTTGDIIEDVTPQENAQKEITNI